MNVLRSLRLLPPVLGLLLGSRLPAESAASPQAGQPLAPAASPGPLADAACIGVDELQPGMEGLVWTVFQGTQPEPFRVRVTGVLRNTLGPGKSMIICELTDPRVQSMGATAGMSGSPLYIQGRLAGALSYQVQRFETVRYAGFTPVADLREVGGLTAASALAPGSASSAASFSGEGASSGELRPVAIPLVISGLSPQVLRLLAPEFERLGLNVTQGLAGSSLGTDSQAQTSSAAPALQPGSPVSVGLVTGDISMAGTGTVSLVEGNRITAFGHPMMGLGAVEMPLCSAEILTILPSSLNSYKLANVGKPIGTLRQDRLSAIGGFVGPLPRMIEVDLDVVGLPAGPRHLHYSVVREQELSPLFCALGILEAVSGSNGFGNTEGFRLHEEVRYAGRAPFQHDSLQAGPQALVGNLLELLSLLRTQLYNPYEKIFPEQVTVKVEALEKNPQIVVETLRCASTSLRPGDVLETQVAWRDYQGARHVESVSIPIDPAWAGRNLDLLLVSGAQLDFLSGRPRLLSASRYRSFDEVLRALSDQRLVDGLYLAVVEKGAVFSDESLRTAELPGSLQRVASRSDEARFQRSDGCLVLKEYHLLPGHVGQASLRRALTVSE